MSDDPSVVPPFKRKWILLQNTVADGTIPYYAPPDDGLEQGQDYGFLFDTEKEAKIDLWDGWRNNLSDKIVDLEGDEDISDPDFDGWVEECILYEDGSIMSDTFGAWSQEQIYKFFGMEPPTK